MQKKKKNGEPQSYSWECRRRISYIHTLSDSVWRVIETMAEVDVT